MVDVAGGPDDNGHADDRAARPCDRRREGRRRRRRSTVRRSRPGRASLIRPTMHGSATAQGLQQAVGGARLEGQAEGGQRLAGKGSATDVESTVARPETRPASSARQALPGSTPRGTCRTAGARGDHPPDRDLARRPGRPGTGPGSRRAAAIVTLSGRVARASGSRRSRATRSARPTMRPACGPADQLVAAERDQVGAGRQPLGRASARGPGRIARSAGARRCRDRR